LISDGEYAFKNHLPQSVKIPDTVTSIGKYAFYSDFCSGSKNLRRIEYHHIAFLLSEEFDYRQALELTENIRKFLSGSEDAGVLNYLREHRADLLFLDNLDVFQKILDSEKIFTKNNIDEFIIYAAENQKHEFQIMLINYKQKKGWYEDTATIIRKKFEL